MSTLVAHSKTTYRHVACHYMVEAPCFRQHGGGHRKDQEIVRLRDHDFANSKHRRSLWAQPAWLASPEERPDPLIRANGC